MEAEAIQLIQKCKANDICRQKGIKLFAETSKDRVQKTKQLAIEKKLLKKNNQLNRARKSVLEMKKQCESTE